MLAWFRKNKSIAQAELPPSSYDRYQTFMSKKTEEIKGKGKKKIKIEKGKSKLEGLLDKVINKFLKRVEEMGLEDDEPRSSSVTYSWPEEKEEKDKRLSSEVINTRYLGTMIDENGKRIALLTHDLPLSRVDSKVSTELQENILVFLSKKR